MSLSEDYPRVLFITPHAFNKVSGTGITFTNLFFGWPKDRIATVHDDCQPVTYEVCDRFYRLGPQEIRKFGGTLANRETLPKASNACGETQSAPLHIQALQSAKNLIFGDGLPQSGLLSLNLETWIEDFKPDVIFTILGSIGLMEVVEKIQARYNLPLIVHMMDDWPSVQFQKGLLGPFQRRRMAGLVRRLMDRSEIRMGICDSMCRAFEERYGGRFVPFQNTVDVDKWHRSARDPSHLNDPIRVVYAGSVYPNAQLTSLRDCCRAVAELCDDGYAIQAEIYSPSLTKESREILGEHPAIHFNGALTDDRSFFDTIGSSDILLMPSNFDNESVNFIRYSMPTRVPAYLAVGMPILVYGSPVVAQVQYACEFGWGLVVSNQGSEALKNGIVRLINDIDLRRRLSAAALSTARERHDASILRDQFRDEISTAAVSRDIAFRQSTI
ncbi:MAG: hypothetical protein HN403_17270 [Rhodospirillales bacterium]|nr:hypothetical protein [Rhodospirillales bacterium]